MKKRLEFSKKIKSNKGSITSFTLLSMIFFLVVLMAIFASVNTKVQKQDKELKAIKDNYKQENIDDIYENTLNGKAGLLATYVKVGDYVSYEPDTLNDSNLNTLKTNLSTYSGKSDSTINSAIKRDDLKWRVLDVNKKTGEVRLISEESTISGIELYGYNGYNNGVKLIDDACATLYSNKKLASKVQNLKIEDIQSKMKEKDYTKFYKRYGEIKIAYATGGPICYPSIFLKEKEQKVKIGNITIKGMELGLSEQKEYIKQEKENVIEEQSHLLGDDLDNIEAKVTHWSKKMQEEDFYNSQYYEIFMGGKTEEDTFIENFLSSRCIALWDLEGTSIEYCISTMGQEDGWIDDHEDIELYEEAGGRYAYSKSGSLRPVITLKSNVKIDTTNLGDGTQDKPYNIML